MEILDVRVVAACNSTRIEFPIRSDGLLRCISLFLDLRCFNDLDKMSAIFLAKSYC